MAISADIRTADADQTSRYAKWAIALFFVMLFIPGSFYIGVRLTPYRLYLFAMAVPMLLRFHNDPTLRINAVDILVFLTAAWRSLAILVNHQASEITNAGMGFIEFFFGYLLGRAFIRTASDYRFFFRCFLVTLLAFLPFALIESVTHQRVLRELSGIILTPPPIFIIEGAHVRFGLLRAQLSFDHALHFGIYCVIGLGPLYYIYQGRFLRRFITSAFVAFMAMLAISSSALLAIALQTGLIVYDKIIPIGKWKWYILAVFSIASWFLFQLVFSMTIVDFVVSKVVFSSVGAEGRLDQITYGLKEIYGSPIFGIGLDEAALPFWRGDVIDNTWLRFAIAYGVPGFVLIALAFGVHFFSTAASQSLDETERQLRIGYLIALVATVFLIAVVTLWGIVFVFIMVFFGAGAWFYENARGQARLGRRYRERLARSPGRPAAVSPGLARAAGSRSRMQPAGLGPKRRS